MFQKLLLATDGSTHANKAAEHAIQLAKQLGASITLMHVSNSAPNRSELFKANFDVKSILEDHAHQAIVSTEKKLDQAGIKYHLKVALGEPAAEIVRVANEEKHDLIIVGSRGLNKLKQVLMGSVSHEVLQEAKCPVLIVK